MILAAIGIAVVAVVGIAIVAWVTFQGVDDSFNQVVEPQNYLNEVNLIVADLFEAESSLRSYALTGNEDELNLLKVKIQTYSKRLDRLRTYSEDAKDLLVTTDTIAYYVKEKYKVLESLSEGEYVLTGELIWNSLQEMAIPVDSLLDVEATEEESKEENEEDVSIPPFTEEQIKRLALKLGITEEEVSLFADWNAETWLSNMVAITSEDELQQSRGDGLDILMKRDQYLTGKLLKATRAYQNQSLAEEKGKRGNLDIMIEQNQDYLGLAALLVVVFCLLLLWNIFRSLDRNKQLQEQLEEEKARAEKLAAAKEEFLANMSHEIRTPMNAVIGFAEQLAGTRLDSKQKNMLNPIRQSANYLLALINDVLDYSKMDAGAFRLEQTNFRVVPVIQEVITTFAHSAQRKQVQLRYVPNGELPEILLGDPLRLRQMLFNLVGNAVKFTEKGKIEVSTSFHARERATTGKMVIAVKDTGIGIPPDRIDSVFSDFEQADSSTTRKYGGTGLGLPITKRLAEVHGGTISIRSEKGKGTTVTLHIPYEIGTRVEEEPVEKLGLPSHQSLKGLKVLLADDEPYNQQLIKVIMDKWEIHLDAVDNGRRVIDKLRADNSYDLILMDLQMPEMDGMESTRYIRQKLKLDIPILAMTATSTEKEIAEARHAGMNAHLLKPFQEVELLSLLSSWLTPPQGTTIEPIPAKNDSSAMDDPSKSYDLKTLYKLSNQDRKMVLKMLKLFQGRSQSHLLELKRALKNKDYVALGARAHQMIPSCRHLGLDFLVSQLSYMESMVKKNEIDPEAFHQAVDLIESEFKVVTGQIDADIKKLELED